MKAILMTVLALGLVGALAGGGLFAYFSDTEVSTGNTFKAGTIDIILARKPLSTAESRDCHTLRKSISAGPTAYFQFP